MRKGCGKLIFVISLVIPQVSLADISPPAVAPGTVAETPNNCLTKAEAELAALINGARKDHDLPAISVKKSLYRVAKLHVVDLAMNQPHRGAVDDRGMPCNLHSWSDKGVESGGWNSVCYTSDHRQASGMWNKLREISDHRSNGYEIIYWTSAPLSPSMAMNHWQGKPADGELILEKGVWSKHRWKSIGVGVYDHYAAVWFSEKLTSEAEMAECSGK